MTDPAETRWIFDVNGHQVEGVRTQGRNVTAYNTYDDHQMFNIFFTEKQLPALRAFLAAMETDPVGTAVERCEHCGGEVRLKDGRWILVFDGVSYCTVNLDSPSIHEPSS